MGTSWTKRKTEATLAAGRGWKSEVWTLDLRPWTLGFSRQVFADTLDGVALVIVQGEEFESIAESLAVANDGADFDGVRSERQRDFKRDDFSRLEAAGEGCADSILAHFSGASPAGAEFSGLEHLHLQADVDDEAGKAARELRLASRHIRGSVRASCVSRSGGGLSFLLVVHAS